MCLELVYFILSDCDAPRAFICHHKADYGPGDVCDSVTVAAVVPLNTLFIMSNTSSDRAEGIVFG